MNVNSGNESGPNAATDSSDNGLVCGYLLDGKGGAQPIEPDQINQDFGPDAVSWLHFDFTNAQARDWIRHQSGLPEHLAEAMIATDSRPRCSWSENGVLTALRGVNLNPGEEIEDMISIRVWITGNRIISTRRRKLRSVLALRQSLEAGRGPTGPAAFLVELIDCLGTHISEAIDVINEQLDRTEVELESLKSVSAQTRLTEIRRQAARIRRYLAPQREALERLSRAQSDFIGKRAMMDFYEQTNTMTLLIEDLDLARERAMVAQEDLLGKLAHQQNSRMFILSIIAAVFLPLSFFTGLMGMNVAGLPGTENPWAFAIVVLLMFGAAGLTLWAFKRRDWI